MIQERRSRALLYSLEIYTDGSCKSIGQTRFGGWSFIALRGGEFIYQAYDGVLGTTNQRMELQAVCNALEFAEKNRHPNEQVIIYTDSAYIINCYQNNWYEDWQTNNWMNSRNEPVLNIDLWLKIIPYFDNFWYSFKKVPAHKDNYWNNASDQLAQKVAQKLKDNFRGLDNV